MMRASARKSERKGKSEGRQVIIINIKKRAETGFQGKKNRYSRKTDWG